MSRRSDQVSEIIHNSIANTLNKLKTINGFFTITKVEISPDLKIANIWVSNLKNSNWDIKEIKKYIPEFIENLKKLELKFIPKLYFQKDDSPEYTEKIDQIIQKIHES